MNRVTAKQRADMLTANSKSELRYIPEVLIYPYAREGIKTYGISCYDKRNEYVGSFNSTAVMIAENK